MNQECSPLTSADMFHTDRGPPGSPTTFRPGIWIIQFRGSGIRCPSALSEVKEDHVFVVLTCEFSPFLSVSLSLSLIITLCVCLLTKTCPVKLGSQRKKDRSAFKFADDWKTDIWRNGQEWNIIHKISLRNCHNVS